MVFCHTHWATEVADWFPNVILRCKAVFPFVLEVSNNAKDFFSSCLVNREFSS